MAQVDVTQKAMEASMDAIWMKMRVHLSNIANYETPEYKAKKVEFNEILGTECARNSGNGSQGVAGLNVKVVEDDTTSSRLDGNNVDMETEQLELWKAQAQYAAVSQKISGKYRNISAVISQMR